MMQDWSSIKSLYTCEIKSTLTINEPNEVIDSITGSHASGKSNAMVEGIYLGGSTSSHYFPKGFEKFFPHIKTIRFAKALNEIHQSDLRPLTELEVLNFDTSQLQYLEKDLFKYNTKLRAFAGCANKLAYIHPQVFDHLSELITLFLQGNVCILGQTSSNRAEALKIIQEAKNSCSDSSKVVMRMVEEPVIDETNLQNHDELKNITDILNVKIDAFKNVTNIQQLEVIKIQNELEKIQNSTSLTNELLRNLSEEVNFSEIKNQVEEISQKFSQECSRENLIQDFYPNNNSNDEYIMIHLNKINEKLNKLENSLEKFNNFDENLKKLGNLDDTLEKSKQLLFELNNQLTAKKEEENLIKFEMRNMNEKFSEGIIKLMCELSKVNQVSSTPEFRLPLISDENHQNANDKITKSLLDDAIFTKNVAIFAFIAVFSLLLVIAIFRKKGGKQAR